MIKLIIFFAVIYFGFKLFKSWIINFVSLAARESDNPDFRNRELEDVMVKDPHCQVYFPKQDGIHERINGQDVYFCSQECRDKFVERLG